MLKITHADVTRQNVWMLFAGVMTCAYADVIMPSRCCSMAIPVPTSPSGYTAMKTPRSKTRFASLMEKPYAPYIKSLIIV